MYELDGKMCVMKVTCDFDNENFGSKKFTAEINVCNHVVIV